MKLDDTAKIVSIVSVVVGLFVSGATYFTNGRLGELKAQVDKLAVTEKELKISKDRFDTSARLMVEFELPLARSFAIQYSDYASGKDRTGKRYSLPVSLAQEFPAMVSGWEKRRGLMTGKACEQEGLKARQVVVLTVKNIGHADAEEVSVKAMAKASPHGDPAVRWDQRSADGRTLGYYDLLSATEDWKEIRIPVDRLRGLGSPEKDRMQQKIVLASVSGTTSLYGTVVVPVSISWLDTITNERREERVIEPHATKLAADLMGAEIGSLGSACK